MANVENKNVSPIVALLANFCCLGFLGYLLIGQTTKGLLILVVTLVLSFIGVGIVIAILGLIDVYMTAEAINKGEDIDENEYKLEILYKIMKLIQKDAVYKEA